MLACMFACMCFMFVCTHTCMHACIHVRSMFVRCLYGSLYVFTCACLHVCMICMHVCMNSRMIRLCVYIDWCAWSVIFVFWACVCMRRTPLCDVRPCVRFARMDYHLHAYVFVSRYHIYACVHFYVVWHISYHAVCICVRAQNKEAAVPGRYWKVGLAAAGGGALLFLTGGVAAPSVTASLSAVGCVCCMCCHHRLF